MAPSIQWDTNSPNMHQDDEAARSIHEQVSYMMASELNSLTVGQRATVLEDVHGVGDLPAEELDPSLMQSKLQQMDVALHSIPNKPAFDEAQRLCGGEPNGLVNDLSFRIRFLRAERYNAHDAAHRMVNNLAAISETFGQEGLVRPLYLSDMMLDRENQGSDAFLFSGNFFQVMPFRDRLGRRIVVRSGNKILGESYNSDYKTRLKVYLFIAQELANDIECQIKGVVFIGFLLEPTDIRRRSIDDASSKVFRRIAQNIVPVRISAFHLCIPNDPWFKLASSLLLQAVPRSFRLRSRRHIGSVDECTYKLLTYGIPADQIPIKSSGIIKIADHKRFIAYCQAWEDAVFRNGVEYDGIYCPSSRDVLVGRGPRIKNHVGNEIYRLLLQSKFEQYNASSINQKREIALQVIGEVHAYGGRFLLPAKCCWIKADIETIRAKVSVAFRDVRKAMHAKKNRCYSNSVSMELSTDKNTNFGCI